MGNLPGFVLHNGTPISVETPLGAELQRLEAHMANYRPEANPYPRMLYKATKCPDGIIRVFEQVPEFSRIYLNEDQYARIRAGAEAFNNAAVCRVENEQEHRAKRDQGWRDTAQEAMDLQWSFQHNMQVAAAELNYQDKGLSDKAKAEKAEFAATTMDPVAEVPVRRRGPGRKPKVVETAA